MVLALDGKILGLSPKGTQSYGQALLEWSSKHEILMLGLALYRLCALPAILDRSSSTRLIVDELRSRFIVLINEKLSNGQIDDILIQSLCCALPVDDHLGYADFSIAHLKGMEAILEIVSKVIKVHHVLYLTKSERWFITSWIIEQWSWRSVAALSVTCNIHNETSYRYSFDVQFKGVDISRFSA